MKHNLFEFHEATWRQEIGTAMGVHPALSYANIYLAKIIDLKIIQLAKKIRRKSIKLLVCCSSRGCWMTYFRSLNEPLKIYMTSLVKSIKIYPTQKFTMQHTLIENEKAEKLESIPCMSPVQTIFFFGKVVELVGYQRGYPIYFPL